MLKQILGWLAVIILIFFIAYAPHTAATVFGGIGGAIADIARGFGTFFKDLA